MSLLLVIIASAARPGLSVPLTGRRAATGPGGAASGGAQAIVTTRVRTTCDRTLSLNASELAAE